jgi:hypothetical protein
VEDPPKVYSSTAFVSCVPFAKTDEKARANTITVTTVFFMVLSFSLAVRMQPNCKREIKIPLKNHE